MKKINILFLLSIFALSCKKGPKTDKDPEVNNNGATIAGLLVKEITKTTTGEETNTEYFYNNSNMLNRRISTINTKVGSTDVKIETTYQITYNTDNTIKGIQKQKSQYSTDQWLSGSSFYNYSFTYSNSILTTAEMREYEGDALIKATGFDFEVANGLIKKVVSFEKYPGTSPIYMKSINYGPEFIKETFNYGGLDRSIFFSSSKGALYESYANQFLIVAIDDQDFIFLSKNDVTKYSISGSEIIINTESNPSGKPVSKIYPGKDGKLTSAVVTTKYYYSK